MSQVKNYTLIGTIFLIVSALLTSGSNVFYSNRVQGTSPFFFTFISFLITALFFHGVQLIHSTQDRTKDKKLLKDIVGINLSTAGTFMSFYFSLKYIEPAIVGAIEIGIGPLSSLAIIRILYGSKINRLDLLLGLGAFIGSLFLVFSTLHGSSGIEFESAPVALLGLLSSILCGFCAALAAIFSKRLSVAQWSSSKILAHRFYAIAFLSLFLSIQQGSMTQHLSEHWLWILMVSLIGVTLPLYFLQVGIQYSESFFVMMSLSFIPLFTFVFQLLDPRITTSYHSLSGIIIILVVALFSVLLNTIRSKPVTQEKRKAV
ncbi:DMT family transporter [Halobacillus karajensis]|uniref:EamA-like transporter family protein n=1 Tax=Halobacillus karajensis TaxID=195088 RepID=A0A024P847_9BACI|nr:DMT family transporter [Halobacillus karajensis]CDQ20222.1 EamA-like transporter family protein [Halobacillus karajensis]CDQ25115.1 EamA-like transporter family protein [Halobacillus karajensis]CDQ28524.1 EamA-like transporter family protein [Halobacillus karajensis]